MYTLQMWCLVTNVNWMSGGQCSPDDQLQCPTIVGHWSYWHWSDGHWSYWWPMSVWQLSIDKYTSNRQWHALNVQCTSLSWHVGWVQVQIEKKTSHRQLGIYAWDQHYQTNLWISWAAQQCVFTLHKCIFSQWHGRRLALLDCPWEWEHACPPVHGSNKHVWFCHFRTWTYHTLEEWGQLREELNIPFHTLAM